LIEDLTTGPIAPGSNLLVEFTGASQWYNASFTIAAGWLKTQGTVGYSCHAHSPDEIRSKLDRLGLNCEQLEREDNLFSYAGQSLLCHGEGLVEILAPPVAHFLDLLSQVAEPPSEDGIEEIQGVEVERQ